MKSKVVIKITTLLIVVVVLMPMVLCSNSLPNTTVNNFFNEIKHSNLSKEKLCLV